MAALSSADFASEVRANKPGAAESGMLSGWYEFQHEGGSFEVCLRPGGVFYCPSFPSNGHWTTKGADTVAVAFGPYGNYEFAVTDPVLRELAGCAVVDGQQNPAIWRRMRCVRALGAVESRLLGSAGQGTQWNFQWSRGAFLVEFRGDG